MRTPASARAADGRDHRLVGAEAGEQPLDQALGVVERRAGRRSEARTPPPRARRSPAGAAAPAPRRRRETGREPCPAPAPRARRTPRTRARCWSSARRRSRPPGLSYARAPMERRRRLTPSPRGSIAPGSRPGSRLNVPAARAAPVLRADLRRALQPHLRGQRRGREPLGPAPPAARQAPRLRPRHGTRAPDHLRPGRNPGPGGARDRALRGRVGQRGAVLRHGLRRRVRSCACGPTPTAFPTRPTGGGSASGSSTPWSRSTPSIPTRSASATWRRRRTTSPASFAAGRASGRSPSSATCR